MYSNIKWQSSTIQNHIYFCTNLIELVPSSFPTSWGSLTCDFPVSLQDQFCIGKQDWDLHQIRYHIARKRSPLFTCGFNRCGLGKKKELHCQRKKFKTKGLVQCSSVEERRPREKNGLRSHTHQQQRYSLQPPSSFPFSFSVSSAPLSLFPLSCIFFFQKQYYMLYSMHWELWQTKCPLAKYEDNFVSFSMKVTLKWYGCGAYF